MKILMAGLFFSISFMFINLCLAQDAAVVAPAQVTTADPLVVAAVDEGSKGGIMGWIALHGGFQAAILMLVFSAFTLLSAVREVLYKFDGVAKGDPIPAKYQGLNLVNKLCLIFGKILDFMSGNTAH
jgi:hypothetical protein